MDAEEVLFSLLHIRFLPLTRGPVWPPLLHKQPGNTFLGVLQIHSFLTASLCQVNLAPSCGHLSCRPHTHGAVMDHSGRTPGTDRQPTGTDTALRADSKRYCSTAHHTAHSECLPSYQRLSLQRFQSKTQTTRMTESLPSAGEHQLLGM